jgi:hypothetical protein
MQVAALPEDEAVATNGSVDIRRMGAYDTLMPLIPEIRKVKGIVCNDDFTDTVTDVPWFLRSHRYAFALVQEVKRNNLTKSLAAKKSTQGRYLVRQVLRDEFTAGVAIVVDRRRARVFGGRNDDPSQVGWGMRQMSPAGLGIGARHAIWQDIELGWRPAGKFRKERRGKKVRLLSFHRNPLRAKEAWHLQDLELARVIHDSPYPVIAGMDGNEGQGPRGLLNMLPHYEWRGRHVDGTVAPKGLITKARHLKKRRSDHKAVEVTVALGPR